MNQEDYISFLKGKLTVERAMESMITEIGSGVYAYMVMLGNAGREHESEFYEDIRKEVFDIRSKVSEPGTDFAELSNRMRVVAEKLRTAEIFLWAHKPQEAGLLQSVANESLGLIWKLKEFKKEPR